jgi:acyl carrier protein
MSALDAGQVKGVILSCLSRSMNGAALAPASVPDDFDILAEGIVDSLGFMQLIAELERRFGFPLEFDGLEADQLTVIGPLSRYIAGSRRAGQDTPS